MSVPFKLVVAGATGALGQHVVEAALKRGWQVTALGRDRDRLEQLEASERILVQDLDRPNGNFPQLEEGLRGNDCVFSCLGASVQPSGAGGSKTYSQIDTPCNINLIEAAKRVGVAKFVYVSLAKASSMMHLDYIAAHEQVVQHLAASGLDYAVVRPTGFYSAFLPFLNLARKGIAPLMGAPDEARSNPIADADLAEICLNAISTDFGEQEVGGPEILTRRQLVEKAFEAVGKPVRIFRMPSSIVRAMSALMRPINPRISHITRFYLEVWSSDCIAPAHGSLKILDYFAAKVAERQQSSR